jgi:aromatic ring-opening dioxygenase catalytic subunit (LigB family)
MTAALPSLYIPHGGGPCFFMDDPRGMWTGMADYLRSIPEDLPEKPKAILVISAHWETEGFAVTGGTNPDLLFDYYGFPPHTYELTYPAPGDPALAARVVALLKGAGLAAQVDGERGFDHGVFVPLKLAFPDAQIPVVEMSLNTSLDPALHLAAGAALAPLRDEGVLIIGSGMSFHNMRAYGNCQATAQSEAFDATLTAAALSPANIRTDALCQWQNMEAARFSHPREEHLIPMMVAAGAGGEGRKVYGERVLETAISGFAFG